MWYFCSFHNCANKHYWTTCDLTQNLNFGSLILNSGLLCLDILTWFESFTSNICIITSLSCSSVNAIAVRNVRQFSLAFRKMISFRSETVHTFFQIIFNKPVRIRSEFYNITSYTNNYYQSVIKLPTKKYLFFNKILWNLHIFFSDKKYKS